MLGVRCQSWALWLACALELPYTGLARDGAVAEQARADQLPRLRGPYDLACVYLGVNDVRNPGFALAPFAAALDEILAEVGQQSGRVLVATIPLDLGRPPAPTDRIEAANSEIERLAAEHGAGVCDLRRLRGWNLVLPDKVHLTALGQLHVAALAARALGSERSPIDLADPHRSVRANVRYAPDQPRGGARARPSAAGRRAMSSLSRLRGIVAARSLRGSVHVARARGSVAASGLTSPTAARCESRAGVAWGTGCRLVVCAGAIDLGGAACSERTHVDRATGDQARRRQSPRRRREHPRFRSRTDGNGTVRSAFSRSTRRASRSVAARSSDCGRRSDRESACPRQLESSRAPCSEASPSRS